MTPAPRYPLLAVLVPLGAWLLLWGVVGALTFGYGPLTFAGLAALAGLVGVARPCARRLAAWRGRLPARLVLALLLAVTLVGLLSHARTLARHSGSGVMVDVGVNTECAARHFFEQRRNPYSARCQLQSVAGAPHVTFPGGRPHLYGVRYWYGYPYYPSMFMSYEPARRLLPGLDSIRWGNAGFLLLALAGMWWLATRLQPGPAGRLAGGLAVAGLAAIPSLGPELFLLSVTDLCLAVFALYGFIALSYGRRVAAGILFGFALGAKLMPGALLLPILAVWCWRHRDGSLRLALSLAVTVGALLIPFVAWNPAAFFSATTLYYLAKHAGGDDTALWFFLPRLLRTPFTVLGVGVVATLLWRGLRRRPLTIGDLVAVYFLGQMAFVAFAPMTHLNYLWAVVPLGAVALGHRVAAALAPSDPGDGGPVPVSDAPAP